LVTNLKLLLEVEGPMSTEDVTTRSADVQRVTRGSYSATSVRISNFVADLGQFALIRWRALPDNGKRELSSIVAECDSSDGVTLDKLPPVIPRDLAKIAPREFNEVVLQQSQRIYLNGSRGLSTEVEEFRDFKFASREEFYAQTPEKQSDPVAVSDGWEPFGRRFPNLRQFCAGIATVFPGTSTVESDFSVLIWECDEFRSSLTDFSLEVIMQCKQFKQLQSMNESRRKGPGNGCF
jgi:hypothetical protein